MRRSNRYVVLLRPGGFWGGPEHPRTLLDCLAQPHLHTRALAAAPVATFPDAVAAVAAWERWYITDSTSRTRQRGWTVDYLPLATIVDWTQIPPIRPRYPMSDRDRACLTTGTGTTR
jgi:hypothetical protein